MGPNRAADGGKITGSVLQTILMSYTYVAVWISLSFAVIVYNKYILAPSMYDWPFPISLTMIHMAFCSSLAFVMVRVLRLVEPVNMTAETYRKSVIPIGALYSMSLWFSNSAYIYLSVSFIQMLKALMPVAVYSLGIVFKKETFSRETMTTMVGISIGVAVAAYGELNFNAIGVSLQLGAIAFEATRLILIQILLTSKGLSMNPITSLYYIAPCCLVFLSVPWALVELPALMASGSLMRLDLFVFGTNAGVAFALNLAVFLLVGKTSALTMNVAGVVKDWLLIAFSWSTIGDKISMVNLLGYGIAFLGVCYYNHIKLRAMKSASRTQSVPKSPTNEESGPLLSHADGDDNDESLERDTRK